MRVEREPHVILKGDLLLFFGFCVPSYITICLQPAEEVKKKKTATHQNKADTLTKMSSKTMVTPGAL